VNPEHRIYLGLGSNIEPVENLSRAIELLTLSVTIEAMSSVWETPAVGSPGPNYLNLAMEVKSALAPDELKENVLRKIESQLGRKRSSDKNAPRTVDIDILIADDQLIEPALYQHAYLTVPLAELIPNFSCQELSNETLAQLARRLSQQIPIKKRTDLNFLTVLKQRS